MATIAPFISGMGESATLYARTLGARDSTTNWPAVTWTSSTIKVMVKHLNTTLRDTPAGNVPEVRARLFTASAIHQEDEVLYNGVRWRVEDVEYKHILLSALGYYSCGIVRLTAS